MIPATRGESLERDKDSTLGSACAMLLPTAWVKTASAFSAGS